MYDLPGLEAANDRFWTAIADSLPNAPASLDRQTGAWSAWMDPNLVFSQTCGLPFRARLSDKVTYIGTPDYGIEGCAPGWYTSVIVGRCGEDPDLATGRFAYNDPMSQSGWNAPAALATEKGVTLNATLQSGSHLDSMIAVSEGAADLAALDVVSFRAFKATGHVPANIEVFETTRPTPGLPYIAGKSVNPDPIRHAVEHAIARLAPADAALLQIKSLQILDLADYMALPIPPTPRRKERAT